VNGERWARIKSLLARALELAAGERAGFLDRECAGDPQLRAEVEELLQVADADSGFLEPPIDLGAPRAATPSVAPAQLGEFELHEELGRGGMGVVYRARQASLDRWVALKVLDKERLESARRVGGFQDEARKAAKLRHAGIAAVHAFGESAGTHYFAMEWVPGRDLGRELERLRRAREGAAPAPGERAILPAFDAPGYYRRVAEFCAEVARALQHAHENGLVHRDVKPQNILLRWDAGAVVVDFGIARDESFGRTPSPELLEGTPFYMSPEQVDRARHKLDHRTDVYSLGVVLYESLTLARPFDGQTSHEVLDKIARFEPRPLRLINRRAPRDLAAICSKAMSRAANDRYASAGDFSDDLERFLDHRAILATHPTWRSRAGGFVRRHRSRFIVAAAVLAALSLGAWEQARRQRRERENELAARLTQQVSEFRDAAREPWRLDSERAARLAAASLDLARRAGELPAESDLVRELLEELEHARGRAKDALTDAALRALDAAATQTDATERFTGVARGLILLVAASHAFPEDAAVARLAAGDAVLPRLSVRAPPGVAARVSVRRVDPLTGLFGEPIDLGAAPLEGVRMLPGFQRVIVEFEGGRFVECLRELPWRPATVELAVAPPPPDSVLLANMVRIDGATTCFPDPAFGCPNTGNATAVPSFYVDRFEVSNGEYAAFLAATGAPAPSFWSEAGEAQALEVWRALPVTDVSWHDAVRYAEWAGKRLVTHPEWELVARGERGRRAPWPDDDAEATRGNVAQPAPPRMDSQLERLSYYLASAQTVDSHLGAGTPLPHGVLHLYGNASEFTESVFVHRVRDTWIVEPDERFVLGCAWSAGSLGDPMITHEFASVHSAASSVSRGFRCAKSVVP
jgi:serine/threonine protein kinase/formylglycine-generating enzyme required for sulfatase activity